MPPMPLEDVPRYPFADAPGPGQIFEVAPGIFWARIPLPFQLNHVNVYLIQDDEGWAIVDTGIAQDDAKAAWEALLSGPLAGRTITKVIITHYHPDHIGLAGWLCERFNVSLLTSQASYLSCINLALDPGALEARPYRDFYMQHGLTEEMASIVSTQGHAYQRMVAPLPLTFRRLVAGDHLLLGGRRFNVLSGDGHAPEQIMLFSPQDHILLAADQVIAQITPNISVWAVEPDGDPLGLYLRSLHALMTSLPEDTLVLPGHQLPFIGLHHRCSELISHHQHRCALITDACRSKFMTLAELLPVLFPRPLDPHQRGFAFSETHAHVNRMVAEKILVWRYHDNLRQVTAAATGSGQFE